MLAPHPPGGMPHRGYSAVGLEKVFKVDEYEDGKVDDLTASKVPDQKESFDLGRENDMYQPNIWLPDGVLDGFKETCIDFYWTCDRAKLAILSALAVGLGIDEKFFDSNHGDSDCQLRLIRYPRCVLALPSHPSIAYILSSLLQPH
jgi:isopenicillin N synthase-like dioxygenase